MDEFTERALGAAGGDGGAPGESLSIGDGDGEPKRRRRARGNRDSDAPTGAETPRSKSAPPETLGADIAKTLTVGSKRLARTFGEHWTLDRDEANLLAGAITNVSKDVPGMPTRFALAGKAAWLGVVTLVIALPRIIETKVLMAQAQAQQAAVNAQYAMAQQQPAQARNGFHAQPQQQPDPLMQAERPGAGAEELLRQY